MAKPFGRTNITRSLHILVFASLVLMSVLSLWLLHTAYFKYQHARNSANQFDSFYRVLVVSNNLATERAYTHRYLLSTKINRSSAKNALQQIRQLTDHNLQQIPQPKINTLVLQKTLSQLQIAREKIDLAATHRPLSTEVAEDAINALMQATDYYHQALYSKTNEFIRVEPAILGPILRAQALGELRDITGRLGASFLVPLHASKPIEDKTLANITRFIERINMQWWLLSTHDKSIDGGIDFHTLIQQAQIQFNNQGLPLVQRLVNQSKAHQPYSISSEQFAIQYHESLAGFNALLTRYVKNLQQKFTQDEQQALIQLLCIVFIMLLLTALLLSLILIVRKKLLNPVIALNKMVNDILHGRESLASLTPDTTEEVKTLLASLDQLGHQLNEQKQLSQRLKQQSNEDPLTGLFNRRAFDAHAMQLMYSSSEQYPIWLSVIDLDHFKVINDTWGHLDGDKVLIEMGCTLKAQQGLNELVARTGGEEFIIMFIEPDEVKAKNKLDQLKQAIETIRVEANNGEQIAFTASLGVARGHQCSITALVSQADKFLYQAKSNGRNCICGHGFSEPL